MDRDRIAAELAKDMDRALVKPPPQGKYGEYISAFDVFTTANRIFDWDGWSYTVDKLEQTNCTEVEKTKNDQTYMQWEIGYLAIVTVTVGNAHKQDVGHGQGHSKSLGDAHDSAMKEAVTDALKRTLRIFGNPLGLALYDKTKAHVSDDPDYDPVEVADRMLDGLKHTADGDLTAWSAANRGNLAQLRERNYTEFTRVLDECKDRKARINREEAA